MGDSVDKVLDKIMDDAIASAKKVVGNCNERWKGELNLDTRQFYQEKHTNNFSFDILEEEPTTDHFYKPIIGSGKGNLTYTIDKTLPAPSACNLLTETYYEKILFEGKYDLRTNIAKLKVVRIEPSQL